MGMDYVPRRSGIDSYHLNWAGHELMARTLDLLEADLAPWSSVNDGDHVPAATCRAWAALLRSAMTGDRIRLAKLRGGMGYRRDVPVADGVASRGAGSLSAKLELIDVAFGGEPFAGATPTFPLDAATRLVMVSFADFLAKCGGCRQW